MRIMIVTASYPSRVAPHNGVFIREHARELRALGHQVHVLAPRVFRADPATEEYDGVSVRRFPFWSAEKLLTEYERIPVLRMGSYLSSGVLACAGMARSLKPDAVLAHWAIPAGLITVLSRAALRSAPLVTAVHGADLRLALSGPRIAGLLARAALRRSDRVTVVSAIQRRQVVEMLGVDPSCVEVVPMGVDTRVFFPRDRALARKRLGIPCETRLVLFVGALTELKGVRDLVEAAPHILPDDGSLRMVFAGTGALARELSERAVALGQGRRIELLGPVPHDEVAIWMAAADVLALPSHAEGLPVCLMEAAAVGLPVVATDVGGCREIVALDDRSSLVAPGDVAGIAAALNKTLAHAGTERKNMLADHPALTLHGALDRVMGILEELVRDRAPESPVSAGRSG